MFNFKKVVALMLLLSMFGLMQTDVYANDDAAVSIKALKYYGLSSKVVEFLEAHGIDQSIFKDTVELDTSDFVIPFSSRLKVEPLSETAFINETLLSLINQTDVYSFTDKQIQEYVLGLATVPTKLVYDVPEASKAVGGIYSIDADNRPGDNGIGYEVKSKEGYYETTAFGKIPTVYRSSNNDTSAYMFYTVGTSAGEKMDIGIWYATGNGNTGWRYFWLHAGDQALNSGQNVISGLVAGKEVYFHAMVVDSSWVRLRVLDKNDFSTVYVDVSLYSAQHGITRTNANWNRQITFCNDTANFYNGAYLNSAEFSQAHIYSSTSTDLTTAANTYNNRVGAFGTNATTQKLVKVNDYSAWHKENISITFSK